VENNDVLRRLRYALQLDDAEAARLAGLGGESVTVEAMSLFRLRSEDPAAVPCPDRALGALLSGLVLDRRGPPEQARNDHEEDRYACDNNSVLKRVKVALAMRSDEVVACIGAGGGGAVTDSVIGSFLRRPGARNFQGLGDQMLRRFLSGLAMSRREADTDTDTDTDAGSGSDGSAPHG